MKLIKKEYIEAENEYWDLEIEDNHNFFANNILVHNSNFSFISDGHDVKVAKRTSILNDNELERFYDADIMYDKYKDSAKKVSSFLMSQDSNIKQVQIFGEHFGGLYNSETKSGYTKIQKEVHYIPFTDFIVFDIMITYNDDTTKFLDWDEVKNLSENCGFKVVPELFRGTFEECLQHPNEFITKIPEIYGLEPIEGNVCEGVVLKPIECKRFSNGDRVILKNKNDKFKEKGKMKKIKSNKQIVITDEQRKWAEEITKYIEPNRLYNLFSKGEVKKDWNQFGKMVGLFFKDVLEDFIKDNPEFNELEKNEKKIIQNLAKPIAQKITREVLRREV